MKPADFTASVRETIRRRGMDNFAPGPVLVAVSGGPDSLALLHALHRLGYGVEVAHFDHRVREGSAKDSAFVKKEAEKLRVPSHFAANDEPPQRSLSPEEALRNARLAWLDKTAAGIGAPRIATGHTLDDQAETVLMRMVAGAGRRGLGGIPPVRGHYIRPLIDRTRAEIEAFCAALKLKPRRDPTNDDPSFRRNAIRADLLPHLAAGYNARVAHALARTADVLRDEDALLDALAEEAVQPDAAAGALRVSADALSSLHPALQRRVIRRLAPLEADQTDRVRRLALEGSSGDQLFLSQGLNARLEYGWLVIGPAPSSPVRPETVTLEVPGTTELPGRAARIRATVTAKGPFLKEAPMPDGITACVVDAAAAAKGLVVRAPKSGDRLRPLGMRGAKTLGDFFTDQKVPRGVRSEVPIVASKTGIVWVVGHRIDDRAKVTAATKRVLVLEWETT